MVLSPSNATGKWSKVKKIEFDTNPPSRLSILANSGLQNPSFDTSEPNKMREFDWSKFWNARPGSVWHSNSPSVSQWVRTVEDQSARLLSNSSRHMTKKKQSFYLFCRYRASVSRPAFIHTFFSCQTWFVLCESYEIIILFICLYPHPRQQCFVFDPPSAWPHEKSWKPNFMSW